jgi:AAA domain-containing protein
MADVAPFVAGGAVQAGGGVYLERQADRELLRHCLAGDFTYILTSRQMGKSSLMYRTAEQLATAGARRVIIDLTELGAQTTADQWYKGFLLLVQEQLDLQANASDWWDTHATFGYAHRLVRYLREVALVERSERLVLFVDEIDTTLRLDFTDDFFAAIRFLYQNRAIDPELERISFVLIGVAMPNDLIKDAARTPFNIGHRIELTDFTDTEAAAVAHRLAVPSERSAEVIAAIWRWTRGHPYLTMRVLRSLAESPLQAWTAAAIDARIHALFLGTAGESDTNLQFVRDMLTKKAFDREAVLRAYETIRRGGRVPDRELDQIASWLKLSGIVRRDQGLLRVRNPIYEQVFDLRWARVHRSLNVNWRRRLTRMAAALLVVAVIVTIPLAIYALQQKRVADAQRQQAEISRAEAERQRDEAARQLLTTERNLRTAELAVAELKRFDPGAADPLSKQIAAASSAADKELRRLTEERETLRRERDEARGLLQKTLQENAALKQALSRASQTGGPPQTSVPSQGAAPGPAVVPNLVGRGLGDPPVGSGSVPPVTTAPRGSDETAQLLQVLQRYKAAYEALDAKAVSAVYPATNVPRLQSAFNNISKVSYDVTIGPEGIVVAPDGQSATISATETIRMVMKFGSVAPQTGTAVFQMRKSSGVWTIQSIKSNSSRN